MCMEQYILRDEDHLLSPAVVVATIVLIGMFALGILYQLIGLVLF